MPPARRALTEAERAAWAAFAHAVRPLPGRAAIPPPPKPPPGSEAPGEPRRPESHPLPGGPLPGGPLQGGPLVGGVGFGPIRIGIQPGGLDNATWHRFQSGRIAPTRTLDLHGRTAHRAFHALVDFVHRAHTDRLRCVEIITGRGTGEAGGVLKRELPLWLNLSELRSLVLAAAHPHAANPGSVRLLLRRAR
jgi:DNA-nicking Smr family endonuclease